ncbi:MAG: hypothetical protein FWE05_00395 [Defluviitaleaceae bacterium]|nr:hypothetical protein [Defluviitaleaceae bacterium]
MSDSTNISREEAINLLLSSIAMEEVALSHVINAEGEKIQYILGTLDIKPTTPATISEILEVNNSVERTLDVAAREQIILKQQMESALNASIMQGPTGPTGPKGDAGGVALQWITEANYDALTDDQKLSTDILWVIYPN